MEEEGGKIGDSFLAWIENRALSSGIFLVIGSESDLGR